MKKVYSEPDILFESFALTTNIAAGCELQPNTSAEGCGVKYTPQLILFSSDVSPDCNRAPGQTGIDYYDQFCYHTNTSDLNVFFS